jgi:hypothetical protein
MTLVNGVVLIGLVMLEFASTFPLRELRISVDLVTFLVVEQLIVVVRHVESLMPAVV